MRSRIARLGVVLALSTAALGVAVAALGLTTPPPSQPQASGVRMDAAAAGFPTAEDHCYIEGMIPHHEQALELSGLVLDAAGVRERTRALAEFIVADQTAEIETMRAWQSAWQQAVQSGTTAVGHGGAHAGGHAEDAGAASPATPTACGDHPHAQMKGMASPAQVAALDAAEGAAADRMFLELMIAHHDGALEMAEAAVRGGSNAYVRTSAKHVLVEQAREITAMSALLAEAP
ncbi:DUF305 domain-containing protein [Microbacterium jejuense]|uniref:DUF305 domain-containing protein n=1 Tax=Microbacterium jejuense TaxID=1263637 RepID=A0ABS7HJH1_9MICO|nr:DUF305 domain-containing protein [Microbacterium jejuense]MBW9092426.1 DUF305 domain-containing protein [Microbacterium jejuense]